MQGLSVISLHYLYLIGQPLKYFQVDLWNKTHKHSHRNPYNLIWVYIKRTVPFSNRTSMLPSLMVFFFLQFLCWTMKWFRTHGGRVKQYGGEITPLAFSFCKPTICPACSDFSTAHLWTKSMTLYPMVFCGNSQKRVACRLVRWNFVQSMGWVVLACHGDVNQLLTNYYMLMTRDDYALQSVKPT